MQVVPLRQYCSLYVVIIAVLLWLSFVNERYFCIKIIQEMIHPGDLFTTGATEFFTPVGLDGDMGFDVE